MDEEWNDGVDLFFAEFAKNDSNESCPMSTRKLNRLKYEHNQKGSSEGGNSAQESIDKETIVAMARRRIAESVLRNASKKDIERARQSLHKTKNNGSSHQRKERKINEGTNEEVGFNNKNCSGNSITSSPRQNEKHTSMCRKQHKLSQKMQRKAARMEESKTQLAKERKAVNKNISSVCRRSKIGHTTGCKARFQK